MFVATLSSRSQIAVGGPDWRSFLQGLITQDVETLGAGELRFAALLTPQGRLLFDLFVLGMDDGCRLDCAADRREALIERLRLYRLRAKVEIEPVEAPVCALWDGEAAPGWIADPRLPDLGWRAYDDASKTAANAVGEDAYVAHALRLGVPGPSDHGSDTTYPIEANFDLLHGIDFNKGCFVGQETTSRMKRRGAIKSRMLPIAFDGPAPPHGGELLAGDLRAGVALSGREGSAMGLLRLDRMDAGERRMADGRPWSPAWPEWLKTALRNEKNPSLP